MSAGVTDEGPHLSVNISFLLRHHARQ